MELTTQELTRSYATCAHNIYYVKYKAGHDIRPYSHQDSIQANNPKVLISLPPLNSY